MSTAQSLTIVLTIDSLGEIPEHQQHGERENALTSTYFTDGLSERPMQDQIAHYGEARAKEMVASELRSWLEDLGTGPYIQSIAVSG